MDNKPIKIILPKINNNDKIIPHFASNEVISIISAPNGITSIPHIKLKITPISNGIAHTYLPPIISGPNGITSTPHISSENNNNTFELSKLSSQTINFNPEKENIKSSLDEITNKTPKNNTSSSNSENIGSSGSTIKFKIKKSPSFTSASTSTSTSTATQNFKIQLVKNILTTELYIPKPIIKWIGGKSQILNQIIGEFPIEMTNYREVFVGGGSVLLALMSYVKNNIIRIHENVYAYDLNEPLIYVYKNVQKDHNKLYDEIQKLINDFNSCEGGKEEGKNEERKERAKEDQEGGKEEEINRDPKNIQEAKKSKESYYYWIRSKYNQLNRDDKNSILGSAMFIFLNKTGFRGVFRIGPKGYNVPYGNYVNPEIINKAHLDQIHDLIQDVIFECLDFTASLSKIELNDYAYLDPPYVPEKKTSFVKYNVNGFNDSDHNALFELIHSLTRRNIKMMLSNSDVSLVRNTFTNEKYNITTISCRRAINSKSPDARTNEVIIKNY